jgi:signal transduction histidine kinase
MADAIAAHDWSGTALGHPETWPTGAVTLVAMMLEAKQPMFLAWGPERILIYNDAYAPLLGMKHPGALGSPFYAVWHEAADSLRPLVDRVFAGNADYMDHFHLVLDRGEGMKDAYFAFSYSPVRDADGAVGGLFCVCNETTAGVLAEDRIREIQAELLHMSRFSALGEMASALAHELNQPLTAISNYLGGCRRLLETAERPLDETGTAVLAEAIGEATGQALRAGEIIRSLRAFVSRADARRQATNLGDLMRESCTLALLGSTHVDVRLTVSVGADLTVHVDRVQIQQVILNLLRNAIEAMAERPVRVLTITAASLPDTAFKEVVIEDSGGGLDPQIAARLFQPFQTTKANGMGVGLSICRTIVEAHGGRISAQSQAGYGTTFRFTLPKFAEDRHAP